DCRMQARRCLAVYERSGQLRLNFYYQRSSGSRRHLSPTLTYSLVYFALNAANAVNLAFFPLHCKNLGFSPFQIAVVSAALNIGTIVGAPGFTNLAHFSAAPRKIFFWCSLLGTLLYVALLRISTFPVLMCVWLPYAICWSGCSVMTDTRAIRESASGVIRFES